MTGMKRKKLSVLTLAGGPRERGISHGEEMREEIVRHLELWQEDLSKDTGMSPDDYLDRFYAETDFLPAIKQFAPDILEEVKGIAEGSGQDFRVVLIRQMSDEDPWFRQIVKFGRPIMVEHCSSLGAWDQEEQPNLIAQNMDTPGYCDSLQLILKIKEAESELESLVFTVAGKISLAGMNNRCVGVCCNTLLQLNFNPKGLPEDFIIRKTLQQPDLTHAIGFMNSIPHASGQNYIVGDMSGVVDLECSGSKVVQYSGNSGQCRLFHTNHPLINDDQSSWKRMIEKKTESDQESAKKILAGMTTELRFKALSREVQKEQPLDVKRAVDILSQHEGPICTHHGDDLYTLGCLIMELDPDNPRFHIAPGPPCETQFSIFDFDG
jgi:isopenicillin-N N-acyltransferase-like protein